ncbi:MAG: hypothetical protein GY842_10410 [bacterium]|nr:hypothetical protein [bacterium]
MRGRTVMHSAVGPTRPRGFSLVELLVVFGIIVLLIGTVIGVGRRQISRAKESEARAVLDNLNLAAKQFADEKPLGKVRGYSNRYGPFPPDELDGFVKVTSPPGFKSRISPGGASSYVTLPTNNDIALVDNGDIKAFALAIRSYSESGAAILDRIQLKYRHAAHKDLTGVPDEYLDRDGDAAFTPSVDEPLGYFVDPWGTPIAYFAMRQGNAGAAVWDNLTPGNVQTAGDRGRLSRALLSLSNSVPVFVSYGADGREQFNPDFLEGGVYPPDLIYDYNEDDSASKPEFEIDHPLNVDNLYSNAAIQDKILRGPIAPGVLVGTED